MGNVLAAAAVAEAEELKPTSSLKHVQVRQYVRALVSDAPPGSGVPSERDLVQLFGVARMTVRQALDVLVSEGLLERIPGRGTFVARAPVEAQLRLTSFTEEMRRRDLACESRTLVARRELAGAGVARALEIDKGADVVHWKRVRYAGGAPMCLQDVYLPEGLVPDLLTATLPESLYAELGRRGLLPSRGEDSVTAGTADDEQAELLGVAAGASVLGVARRAFAGEVAVEVSRTTFRADRYALWVPLAGGSVPAARTGR
jgi:GntR family transcriptional regulator